jgi:hypothetical protein
MGCINKETTGIMHLRGAILSDGIWRFILEIRHSFGRTRKNFPCVSYRVYEAEMTVTVGYTHL